MVKNVHHNIPEPSVASSNGLFCVITSQKWKDILFIINIMKTSKN